MPPRKTKDTPAVPTELTLEQALALIAELQAQVTQKEEPSKVAPASATPEQLKQIATLQRALIGEKKRSTAARKLAEQTTDEAVFEVSNMLGATLVVEVTDHRGIAKRIMFENKGTSHYLTASQVSEIKTQTDFFEKGYLAAPDVVENSPNAISDFDVFVGSLTTDSIRPSLAAITNPEVLWGLYHHIESQRYDVVDNELKQKSIDTKTQMVLYATIDRLREETGVNITANDAE